MSTAQRSALAWSSRIVHCIPGRVRFSVPAIKKRPMLGERLRDYLADQDGIAQVEVNVACGSVVIVFSSSSSSVAYVEGLLTAVAPERLETYQPKHASRRRLASHSDDGPTSTLEVILSSTGVAVGLLTESVVPILPLLLLGSSITMLRRAFEAFTRRSHLTVDVLDASATALLAVQGKFPMALFMVWLVNVGDFIRHQTVRHAQSSVKEVLAYRRYPAWLLQDGKKIRVSVEAIQIGDTIVVYPGERIPVDGEVMEGQATVDQQALTGESVPVEKGPGAQVYAATVVQEGHLYVRAHRIGQHTEAATVVRLVKEAPIQETRAQNYAEQWANGLVPYSFAAAALSGATGGGLQGAASLLIIDYGTGIRVAAPTTVLAAMTKALRHGILIKGGRYLEQLAEIDAVVFDKTGTLTMGRPEIRHVIAHNGYSVPDLLALAAAAEQRLSHPLAHAIVEAATRRGISLPARSRFRYTVGQGVEASVAGSHVLVGNQRFLLKHGISMPAGFQSDLADIEQAAQSPLCVAADGAIMGVLACSDALRPEASDVIQGLKARGVREIVMLTGDRSHVAHAVAQQLGISRYHADLLPKDKVALVRQLQGDGYTVAVVGDGINDSPALAYADVGIAMEGGTDAARETAPIALLHGGLWKLPLALDIGREAMSLIRQNWAIIAIPNTVALTLAFFGILGPGASTLLSNGSAIFAAGNALRPLFHRGPQDYKTARAFHSSADSMSDQ